MSMMMLKRQRAVRRDLLQNSFASVPLGFKLLGGPLNPKSAEIVQLDIRDSARYGEYFRIWPGAPDNEIEVTGTDHKLRQLVLRVKEAKSENERSYLCGHDDVRMFIAEVPRGTSSVSTAHSRLRPMQVFEAQRRWPDTVVRQGEWFFVPIEDAERAVVELHLAKYPRLPLRDQRLGKGGRPHFAEEQVVIHARGTFARGRISHIGHNALHLPDWRRVLHNLEGKAGEEERRRLRWID